MFFINRKPKKVKVKVTRKENMRRMLRKRICPKCGTITSVVMASNGTVFKCMHEQCDFRYDDYELEFVDQKDVWRNERNVPNLRRAWTTK